MRKLAFNVAVYVNEDDDIEEFEEEVEAHDEYEGEEILPEKYPNWAWVMPSDVRPHFDLVRSMNDLDEDDDD